MNKGKDNLGDRMKGYENAYRIKLPERLPVMLRIDGKSFHTYTKGFKRPFDEDLANAMWETTKYLCANIQGAKVGYTQSDEITILLTNYEKLTTDSWFDNNLQKMCSVAASLATARFNEVMREKYPEKELALFDARAWVLPKEECLNALIWRQQDSTKNSISMVAQANFSHKSLQGLNSSQLQDKLLLEKGINWNDLPIWQKRGVAIVRKQKPKTVVYNGEEKTVMRNVWEVDLETPIFSQDRNYIEQYVYKQSEEEVLLEKVQTDIASMTDLIMLYAQEMGYEEFRKKFGERAYENEEQAKFFGELLEQLKKK